jgi:hypothetical protein
MKAMRQKSFGYAGGAILLFSLLFLPAFSGLYAQNQAGPAPADGTAKDGEKPALPRQYRELSLGMELDDLKNGLQRDDLFNFRGDRDVSLFPMREQSLVETTGSSFIRRAFFQLRDGRVFIMAFSLNTEIMDHYSVFTTFVQKYGEPSYLDPRESVWETEDTRIAIERPLTIKYIDKRVFNDIINESGLVESRQTRQRQEFLDEF